MGARKRGRRRRGKDWDRDSTAAEPQGPPPSQADRALIGCDAPNGVCGQGEGGPWHEEGRGLWRGTCRASLVTAPQPSLYTSPRLRVDPTPHLDSPTLNFSCSPLWPGAGGPWGRPVSAEPANLGLLPGTVRHPAEACPTSRLFPQPQIRSWPCVCLEGQWVRPWRSPLPLRWPDNGAALGRERVKR